MDEDGEHWVLVLRKVPVLPSVLSALELSLRCKQNLYFTEAVLHLLLTLARTPQVGEREREREKTHTHAPGRGEGENTHTHTHMPQVHILQVKTHTPQVHSRHIHTQMQPLLAGS